MGVWRARPCAAPPQAVPLAPVVSSLISCSREDPRRDPRLSHAPDRTDAGNDRHPVLGNASSPAASTPRSPVSPRLPAPSLPPDPTPSGSKPRRRLPRPPPACDLPPSLTSVAPRGEPDHRKVFPCPPSPENKASDRRRAPDEFVGHSRPRNPCHSAGHDVENERRTLQSTA